jgi:hypothetical protein
LVILFVDDFLVALAQFQFIDLLAELCVDVRYTLELLHDFIVLLNL